MQELEPRIQTASELVKTQLAENDKGAFKSYNVLNISRILWPRAVRVWELDPSFQQAVPFSSSPFSFPFAPQPHLLYHSDRDTL